MPGPSPGPSRSPSREPVPWFVLVLIAVAAFGLVLTSAARILRYDVADLKRERQWQSEHQARMRELAELARAK